MLRLPERLDRRVLIVAASVWVGVLAASRPLIVVSVLASLAALRASPRRWLLLAVVVGVGAGSASGVLVSRRESALTHHGVEAGPVVFTGTAMSDAIVGAYGITVVVDPDGVSRGVLPDLAIATRGWSRSDITVGDRVSVSGMFTPESFRVGRRRVAGAVQVHSATRERAAGDPALVVANRLRAHIVKTVDPDRSDARALIVGFLIGDTSSVSLVAMETMRSAGLTHFVAVSGSNVALFLGLWWLILSPLALRSWPRAAVGIVGLVIFAAVTRWEPSVVRASVCAGVLLAARAAGLSLSGWTVLGSAVAGCLLLAGELASDVGFQLSVLATIGVMTGASMWDFRPKWVSTALGASAAAQLAVAPVLVSAFGSIPLLAPIANVLSAPLVAVATAIGGIGALSGWQPLLDGASVASSMVLAVARVAAPWPQVGFLAVTLGVVAMATGWRLARPVMAPALAALIAISVWPTGAVPVELPMAAFLDVGQGDAALFRSEDATVLVDGGPDPVRLHRELRRYGIDRIDLVVVSHVHRDHIEGLEAVLGTVPVGAVAFDFGSHATPASSWLETEARRLGIRVLHPDPGFTMTWPELSVRFVGPVRRYASPNDESTVAVVEVGDIRVLMTGDVETHAQADLEIDDVDVLKVPHQGGATSDLDWLERHAGRMAVISVGPNDYGHPDDEVMAVLERAGSTVRRTDIDGDIVLSGGRLP